ncbi:MAG: hypothetical protein PHE16_05365 [Aliarcobacter sp.]|nr:hypothetical protein [Aliarcobacter sp.]
MSGITNQTNNFQNSENDIAQKFDNVNIGQLNNTFTFSNEFIITFKYDSNFRELLNFDEAYLKTCEYIRIYKNQKQLVIQIENENSKIEKNILTLFELEIKSEIKERVEKLNDNLLNKSTFEMQFTDMIQFNIETEIAYRTITNQERLILIFRNESNEDKEIFELIEKYPDVEFICDNKMIWDKMKFIEFQIKKLENLKTVVSKKMFQYVKLLQKEWHVVQFRAAPVDIFNL